MLVILPVNIQLTGILLRAKTHGIVGFEKDSFSPGRDNDALITLLLRPEQLQNVLA